MVPTKYEIVPKLGIFNSTQELPAAANGQRSLLQEKACELTLQLLLYVMLIKSVYSREWIIVKNFCSFVYSPQDSHVAVQDQTFIYL